MKTHTRLLRFVPLVMLFVVLLSASAFAVTEIHWGRTPLKCQINSRGPVYIYTDEPMNNFYGYCLQFSPNINIKTPTIGQRWYLSFKYNDYFEWTEMEGGVIRALLYYNGSFSGRSIQRHHAFSNTLCFSHPDWAENKTGDNWLNELYSIPFLFDYPSTSGEVWVYAWWCNTPDCMNQQVLGNSTYTIQDYLYNLNGCQGYLDTQIVMPWFEGTDYQNVEYGGCYIRNCNFEIRPNWGWHVDERSPMEMVMINTTITLTQPLGASHTFLFQPNWVGVENSTKANRIYWKDITLKSSLTTGTKTLNLMLSQSNITIDNLICDHNPYGDFTFAPNTDIFQLTMQSIPRALLTITTGVHSSWGAYPGWRIPTNLKIINSPNAACLRLRMYDTQPITNKGANLVIQNSNIWRFEPIFDGGSVQIINSKIGEVLFWSNKTTGYYPLICDKHIKPYRIIFIDSGEGGFSNPVFKLPPNCNLVGQISAQRATLDASGNTLSCSDKALFGLDTIADNVLFCAARAHYLAGGTADWRTGLKNAIINDTPLSGLRILSGSVNTHLENVHFTQSVSYMTPELYPGWGWWDSLFSKMGFAWNYSFMDSHPTASLFATNVTLYDTYRILSGANVTGITILGCTGRPGSICNYVPPPITTTTTTIPPPTTTTIPPPPPTTTIPPSPPSYEPAYTPGDLVWITGDVIGRGLIATKDIIPIVIIGVLVLGILVTIRFKLLRK